MYFIFKHDQGDENIRLHKDYRNDDDNADYDNFFSPAKSQRSIVYKEEILKRKDNNTLLKNELENAIKSFPEVTKEFEQRYITQEENLKLLEEENEYLREIEQTAIRDYNGLKNDYQEKISELEARETNNTRLHEQMNDLKIQHNEGLDRIKRFYEQSQGEAISELNERIKRYQIEANEFKAAYQKLEHGNRDLKHKYEDEKSRVKNLEDQLQILNRDRFKLERDLSTEVYRLKHELDEQRNNFSQIRSQGIDNLNASVNQLNTQKQQLEAQYNQLNQEYQSLVHNMNSFTTDQNHYLQQLQIKDKQQQDDRKLYETVYNTVVAEKDSIQMMHLRK